MRKIFKLRETPIDDSVLRRTLKTFDPVSPPTHGSLQSLEARILSRLDDVKPSLNIKSFAEDFLPPWMISQGWTGKAIAFLALLVLASGFVIGQMSYGDVDTSLPSGGYSLLAFADEPTSQATPVNSSSWSDEDEDAE